jgi:hypothetical protein
VLRRCGSRRAKLLTRSRDAQGFQAGGGYVTWLDQSPVPEKDGAGHAVAYEIATGRRWRWPIPGPINPNVSVSHTRHHLFVDKRDSRRVASRRFVATLP